MANKINFLDLHKEHLETLGFWKEEYRGSIIKWIELMYTTEVLTEYGISDIVMNGDKVLVKWFKRHQPLSKEELKDEYGR